MENPTLLDLEAIDASLTEQSTFLKKLSENLSFNEIQEFKLDDKIGKLCNEEYNVMGLYFFEILSEGNLSEVQDWKDKFQKDWKSYNKGWTPGVKQIRLNAHAVIKEWMPLYVGTSLKVGCRINDHIILGTDKARFALRLKARESFKDRTFRVSWIPLKVSNYRMILPLLEGTLRNRLNPIVGRQ